MKNKIKSLGVGFLYFYIHFVTELICFFVLGKYIESSPVMWLIFLTYDMLAFVPQSCIGYISDRFPKFSFGLLGIGFLFAALIIQSCMPLMPFLSLIVLCLGNAFIHVNGAEATLRVSDGKLSHSAIFVSGGSFGVVFGKLLSTTSVPIWLLLLLTVSAVPFAILAQRYQKDKDSKTAFPCRQYNYNNKKISKIIIIILSVTVVSVRGYMAYAIPISWNKTALQTVILFSFMGIGKALGGIFADLFGIKKVALLSVTASLPFLMFGDSNMFVSLFGVLLFSMTMSVTLALLVSVLRDTPGLAFGLTTIGLFIGATPVFFFKIKSLILNCIVLSLLTGVCFICLALSLRKDEFDAQSD